MKLIALIGLAAFALAGPASAESWQTYSRSAHNAFLAEVDGLVSGVGLTRIRVATVPRTGEPGDLSHSIETYEFQCTARKWRTAGVIEYGPDGSEIGQYPEEDAEFEPVRPETMPGYLKEIACDGARASPPHWPTIQAFIEAGRP